MNSRYRDDLKPKRYGQVFSGKKIGDLLVSMLPQDLEVKTIIDPMVGRGDLLLSAYSKFTKAENVVGIDIDKDVISECESAIPNARIYCGDAFRCWVIDEENGWDLVITNPPYIRYQTLKSNPVIGLPDGKEIRTNLIDHIKRSKLLNEKEKNLYLNVATHYSGLSDMSVPSWILCSSLVKLGGCLAIVVPETWFSREYAIPIHYLLLHCFEIIVIARDSKTKWFDNAEVRACLVICRRKKYESVKNYYSDTMLMEIDSKIADKDSLVAKLNYKELFGYEALQEIISAKAVCSNYGFISKKVSALSIFPGLIGEINKLKWSSLEDEDLIDEPICLPSEMKDIIDEWQTVVYDSLESSGWHIGQGLRTGANEFFYATVISSNSKTIIQTGDWYNKKICLPSDCIRKALQRRSEVKGIVVNYDDLKKCILYIHNQVRRADYLKLSDKVIDDFSLMNADLDAYISSGENYNSAHNDKSFNKRSAVITNEKKTTDGYERFWYMLPSLKDRHIPNLCISRVCGGNPEALYINQSSFNSIIVDANFITLYNSDQNEHLIAFALMNSTWAKCFLELTGTKMGGGALKIETSQVRRLVFPRLTQDKQKELKIIGKKILSKGYIDSGIQNAIDEIVVSPFYKSNSSVLISRLNDLLTSLLQERTKKND